MICTKRNRLFVSFGPNLVRSADTLIWVMITQHITGYNRKIVVNIIVFSKNRDTVLTCPLIGSSQ